MTPARIEALRKIVRDAADPPWVLCRDFEGDHLATIKGERVTAEAIAKHAAAVRVYRATFDTTAMTLILDRLGLLENIAWIGERG